ncbi:MAG TPA: zf-HC2 domain-containing protein [Terriglobales bacterium]|nr:zf-HC2 domain-containing protein [Terriglobales bacterium]
MTYESKSGGSNSVHCADFDARLADLLDGAMAGAELETFRAHAEACMDCGTLFTQAKAGMDWLKALPEVEPPANLVHNILAATTHVESKIKAGTPSLTTDPGWWQRVTSGLAPGFAALLQPRLAMTAAMAFFSVSMLLNVAGVNWKDVKNLDLRPSAITNSASMQYHETTAKVVKYYENIRFVYEFETRVRELKKAATSEEQTTPAPAGDKQQQKKDGTNQDDSSQNPPKEQNEKYSLEKTDVVMAKLDAGEVPVVKNPELEGRSS